MSPRRPHTHSSLPFFKLFHAGRRFRNGEVFMQLEKERDEIELQARFLNKDRNMETFEQYFFLLLVTQDPLQYKRRRLPRSSTFWLAKKNPNPDLTRSRRKISPAFSNPTHPCWRLRNFPYTRISSLAGQQKRRGRSRRQRSLKRKINSHTWLLTRR